MAKQETMTVYYGTDPYIINAADLKAFQEKGFTKKASKAAASADDTTNVAPEAAATTGTADTATKSTTTDATAGK